MELLDISNGNILGISQGGMIAQCIEINNLEETKDFNNRIINYKETFT